MKFFKTLTLFIIAILITVVGCKKEEETLSPTTTPTTINPTDALFSNNLEEAIHSSTVNVSNLTSINSSGAVIYMGPNSFVDASGNPVTGNIDIELIVALDNKEMLMLNRPTVTNNGELLISGGIIYINATQMGEQLKIAEPLTTTMPNLTMGGNASSPLSLWTGDTIDNGDFVWIEDTANTLWTDTSYYFNIDTIGWTNLDVLADTGQGILKGDDLSIALPSGLNGGNSVVMMYLTTINSFASIYDSNQDGTFTLGYYQVPIGTIPQFVVVSMDNNVWSYYVSPPTQLSATYSLTINTNDMLTATSEQDTQDQILLLLQ